MEGVFKAVFVLIFVGLFAAVRQAAEGLRRRPGASVNQMANDMPWLRLIRPMVGLVFYVALLDWLLPGTRWAAAQTTVPMVLRWAGGITCVLATLVVKASFSALGNSYRGGVGLWDDHELVIAGPYGRVRHPIYGAFVAMTAGVGLLTANWVIGTAGLVLTLLIPMLRVRTEERQLRERFGSEYARYERATARFIPGIW